MLVTYMYLYILFKQKNLHTHIPEADSLGLPDLDYPDKSHMQSSRHSPQTHSDSTDLLPHWFSGLEWAVADAGFEWRQGRNWGRNSTLQDTRYFTFQREDEPQIKHTYIHTWGYLRWAIWTIYVISREREREREREMKRYVPWVGKQLPQYERKGEHINLN